MNKIITLLFCALVFVLGFVSVAHAQSLSKLAVVEYKDTQELNKLFPISQRVLVYLNGEDFETGIFLALVTDENIVSIKEQKFDVTIVDENPDLDRYILLYHPQINKSDVLKDLGEVRQITPHHTLLKLDEGKEFLHEGAGVEFFENPFLEGITPPPNATPVLPQTVNKGKPVARADSNIVILLISILITVLLGAGVGAFLYLKKKREPDSSF